MLCVLLSVANTFLPTAQAQTEVMPSGSGTQADPYQIDSLDNLAWMQDWISRYFDVGYNNYYKQTADINASSTSGWNSGQGFYPLGNTNIQFSGTYDGNGHTIDSLFVNRTSQDKVGMFGYFSSGTVKNLRLTNINITGYTNVGGLVGYSGTGTITNCSTTGKIGSGGQDLGGLVGEAINSTIDSCYSTVSFNSTSAAFTGGFIGYSQETAISNSYSTGNIIGSSGGFELGGFAGENEGGSGGNITNCYSTGNVIDSSTSDNVGGFVGENLSGGTISKCYCTGNVQAYTDIGGFVGENMASSIIRNSYSRGNIVSNGGVSVGGFAGENQGTNGTIDTCYSTGNVSGGSSMGGLVGTNGGFVDSSFWDTETSGQSSSAGGAGKTTTQMKTQSTFSGWDFSSTWGIGGGINNGYPYLLHTGDHSLPVQAMNFVATTDMNSVTISWTTQSEEDNAGFDVLRQEISAGGSRISDWELISSYSTNYNLKGLGTSTTGRSYDFTDNHVVSGGTYQYKIQSVSTNGTTKDLSTLSVTVNVPKAYALYQNYPNPFNPTTTIRFDLKEQSNVTLDIYNVLGQRVIEENRGTMNAGGYNETVNMDRFASGVYFYRIAAVGNDGQRFVAIKKLVLMK